MFEAAIGGSGAPSQDDVLPPSPALADPVRFVIVDNLDILLSRLGGDVSLTSVLITALHSLDQPYSILFSTAVSLRETIMRPVGVSDAPGSAALVR